MRRTATLLLAVIATACANGNPEDEARVSIDTDTTTFEGFCRAVGHAACSDAVVKGCGAKDKVACEKAREARCLKELPPQGTSYASKNASACVATIRESQDDGALTYEETQAVAKACGALVFSGTGGIRATCKSDYDCRSLDGLSCVRRGGEVEGKCLVASASPIGASCADEAAVCEEGTYCDVKAGTCRPRVERNQFCDGTLLDNCEIGLRCDIAMMGSGRCERKLADGFPCKGDDDCASSLCQKSQGQADGTCVDTIRFVSVAAICRDYGAP